MRQHLPFQLPDEVILPISRSSLHSPVHHHQHNGLPSSWTRYCPHLKNVALSNLFLAITWHNHMNALTNTIHPLWSHSAGHHVCWCVWCTLNQDLFFIYSSIHLPKETGIELLNCIWIFILFPYFFYWHQQNTFLPRNTSTWRNMKKYVVFLWF